MLNSLSLDSQTPRTALTPLPEKPVAVIEPGRSWSFVNLRDLWAYRELFYFLVWRDLKVRYKQTILGIVWVVLQPVLATIVFTVFLGLLARVPSSGAPYPVVVYTGLLPWTLFANAIFGGGNSLLANAHLITKVYFPRMLIPTAAIGARLVDFGIALVLLIPLMLYFKAGLTINALVLPFLIVLVTVFSCGVGLWLAALNVRYRDVGVVMPVMVQLWMFVSPVAYQAGLVPQKYRWLYFLNPMAGIIEGFRSSILGFDFNWPALVYATVVSLLIFVYAAYFFRRVERTFSDII